MLTLLAFANARYIPDAANAIFEVLKEAAQLHASKKRKYDGEDAEILGKVATRALTTETLKEKLARHVEQVRSSSCLCYGNYDCYLSCRMFLDFVSIFLNRSDFGYFFES